MKRFVLLALGVILFLLGACTSSPQSTPANGGESTFQALSLLSTETNTSVPTATLTTTPTASPPTSTPTITPSPTVEPTSTATASKVSLITTPMEGRELVQALRQGGYVIYFRHAATDQSQTDTDTENLENCQTQRNLNQQGQTDALSIGSAFRTLEIPVGQVLSSQFCRARDTAQLAFSQAELTPDLTGFPDDLREQRIAALSQMLSTPPQANTNTVLVAHGFNITNTAEITLAEGEAAVFAPPSTGAFILVAQVLPEEWVQLAQSYAGDVLETPSVEETESTSSPEPGDEAAAVDPDLLLPDLETMPPSDMSIITNSSGQKLLRHTNSILNNGPGSLELSGIPNPDIEKTTVTQLIHTVSGSIVEHATGHFIYHPTHEHWHLENFARYEVWSLTPQANLNAIVALTDKVSYCLRDDARMDIPGAQDRATYTVCYRSIQGISPGWVDIYKYNLPGQIVNITGLEDGVYAFRSITDPVNVIMEHDKSNNIAMIYIEINGNQVTTLEDLSSLEDLAGDMNQKE